MCQPSRVSVKVLVDVHQLGLGETGNETWARNVLLELEAEPRDLEVEYAITRAALPQLSLDPARLHLVAGSSARRLLRDVPLAVRRAQAEVVVAQYTLPLVRVPGVVVIHDLSFESRESRAWIPPATRARYKATIGTSARRARVVLAPTEYTRRELIERYRLRPERVLLAPLALDPALAPRAAPRRSQRSHHVVLCVGTLLPRKNLPVVAQAVCRLRAGGDDVRLRLVGPVRDAGRDDLGRMQAMLGEALDVVGMVSQEQLLREYEEADVVALPSKFEGFGFPLLEAMAAGTPVISSTATCLPEVSGGAALLADPDDVLEWETALRRVLGDDDLARELRRRGLTRVGDFSWAHTRQVLQDGVGLALGD